MVRTSCGSGRLTVPRQVMHKLWIDLHGIVIPVQDSHEEFANAMGLELETLLDAGWVRVQNVPPPYLLIDFQVPLTAAQAKAVAVLFENRFERVVVEFREVVREFGDGWPRRKTALRHCLQRDEAEK